VDDGEESVDAARRKRRASWPQWELMQRTGQGDAYERHKIALSNAWRRRR
jgi:hypothetical protein